MLQRVSLFLFLSFVFVPFCGVAQCAETHVDNATMIFPADVSSTAGETITVETKKYGVCVSTTTGKDGAFATAVRGDDDVITPNTVDGAIKGEELVVESGGQGTLVRFDKKDTSLARKAEPEYEDGAVYSASSVKTLAADSNDIDLSTDTLYTAKDSADVGVSVTLPEADTLTGLQVDVKYDGPKPRIIKGYSAGTMLTNEIGSSKLRVLIYTPNNNPLPKENVIDIRADVTASGQSIDLKRTFAAIGFEENVSEVRLKVGQSPVYIQEGSSNIIVQTDSVGHGETVVGSPSTQPIVVENQGELEGSVTASISGALFAIEGSAAVPPGGTAEIPVTFSPTRTQFSTQSTTATIDDGDGSTDVPVGGTGVGGRGDPTLSGVVDVSDVALISDIILQLYQPDSVEFAAADVLPLGTEGDDFVRVGDLQATQGAILAGNWGDGAPIFSSLQQTTTTARTLAKRESSASKILLRETPGGATDVYVVGANQVQGVQLDVNRPAKVQKRDGITVKGKSAGNGTRLIAYKQGADNLPGDSLHIATIGETGGIDVQQAIGTDDAYNSVRLPVERQEQVNQNKMAVYPNPVRSRGDVELSLREDTDGTLEVLDLLGRTVRTVREGQFRSGRTTFTLNVDGLASGLYFIRFRSPDYVEAQKVTVVQ